MLPKILIICVNDKEKSPNQFPIYPETTLNLSENTVDGIELVKEYGKYLNMMYRFHS